MPKLINKENDQKDLGVFELSNGTIVKNVVLGPRDDTDRNGQPMKGAHPSFYQLSEKDLKHIMAAKPGSKNHALKLSIDFWRNSSPHASLEVTR